MDNLAECAVLTQESLLQSLLSRFYDHKIYTDLGEILVAINPFQSLPIYGIEQSAAYSSSARPVKLAAQEAEEDQDVAGHCRQPHVFKVANRLYADLQSHLQNQTCIISGESGAGKTEACKLLVQQLTYINSLVCGEDAILANEISAKLLQMNPLMEAFGNAKTTLNDNSSRFGKYIQLWTDPERSNRLCGASVSHYLLEKSRVTQQSPGEHNYHIFYFLLSGQSLELTRRFHIHNAAQHNYLRNNPDCHDYVKSSVCSDGFNHLVESMTLLGMHKDMQADIFRLVGAVLLLGNLDFGDGEIAYCNPVSSKAIDAARVLAVEPALLCKSLNAMTTVLKGEIISSPYSPHRAQDCRDAAARSIYGRLFDHVLSLVNVNLASLFRNDVKENLTIGILDLFGFENCELNSFEQLCINLANEQLQAIFNKKVFHAEMAEMTREGLEAVTVSYEDNSDVIDLIMGKPVGLLSLLDEQSVFPKATDMTCLEKFQEKFGDNRNFNLSITAVMEFSVVHFAGKVMYNVEGFLEKNRDTLAQDVIDLFCESRFGLLRSLFLNVDTTGKQPQEISRKKSNRSNQPPQAAVGRFRSSFRRQSYQVQRKPSNPLTRKPSTRKNKVTVGTQFRQSLKQLTVTLTAAEPHFIRCIKPNQAKKPCCFDSNYVSKQMRQSGLVETVRIRREGYSYRPAFCDFIHAYQGIAFPYTVKVASSLRNCFAILNKAGVTCWHLGKTRVFLKYYHEDQLRQCLSDHHQWAILLQAHWRRIMAKKRLQVLKSQANQEKRDLRDFCNSVLATSESILCTLHAVNVEDDARHRAVLQHLSEPLTLPTVPVVNVRKKSKKNKPAVKHTSSVLAWDDGQMGTRRRRWPTFRREKTEPTITYTPRTSKAVEPADYSLANDSMKRSKSEPFSLLRRASFRKVKKETPATEVLVEWRQKELARHSGQYATKWGVMFSAWFHGLMPRARAEELVSCKPNGTFLIRVSEKRFGYTCTVLWNGSPRHFYIEQLPGDGRYRVIGSMTTYPDLADFVDYHSCQPLSECGELLLHPCGEKAKVTRVEAQRRGLGGAGGYQGRRGWRKANTPSASCVPRWPPRKPARRRRQLIGSTLTWRRLLFWR